MEIELEIRIGEFKDLKDLNFNFGAKEDKQYVMTDFEELIRLILNSIHKSFHLDIPW